MRQDMISVVEEPARLGSRYKKVKGVNNTLRREGEEGRLREPMRRPWRNDDYTRHNTGVVRRYLRSQLGRLWDDVYAEISKGAPKGTYLGKLLHEFVDGQVIFHVTEREGELWGTCGYGIWRLSHGDMYVCPESGQLKMFVADKRRSVRRHLPDHRAIIGVDAHHKYMRLDGIWYLLTLSPVQSRDEFPRPEDVVFGISAPSFDRRNNEFLARIWGGELYASHKRQASGREIKRVEAAMAEGYTQLPPLPRVKPAKKTCFRLVRAR